MANRSSIAETVLELGINSDPFVILGRVTLNCVQSLSPIKSTEHEYVLVIDSRGSEGAFSLLQWFDDLPFLGLKRVPFARG
jgi:hypothetical protein